MRTGTPLPLAAALENKRWEMRMERKDFCDLIGISRTTWYAMMRGEPVAGPRVRFKVARRFPDLTELALDREAVAS